MDNTQCGRIISRPTPASNFVRPVFGTVVYDDDLPRDVRRHILRLQMFQCNWQESGAIVGTNDDRHAKCTNPFVFALECQSRLCPFTTKFALENATYSLRVKSPPAFRVAIISNNGHMYPFDAR